MTALKFSTWHECYPHGAVRPSIPTFTLGATVWGLVSAPMNCQKEAGVEKTVSSLRSVLMMHEVLLILLPPNLWMKIENPSLWPFEGMQMLYVLSERPMNFILESTAATKRWKWSFHPPFSFLKYPSSWSRIPNSSDEKMKIIFSPAFLPSQASCKGE